MSHAPPYLSSPESNPSSVLEEHPAELDIFEDKLNAAQAKIDTLTCDAKVLLKSTLLHLGVSQGAWRMISYTDNALEVELEKLADHIRSAVVIPCRFQLLLFRI